MNCCWVQVENEKKETNVKGVEVVDIEDDDWLPPPPKVVSKAQRSIDEDSIVKKLRLSTALYCSLKIIFPLLNSSCCLLLPCVCVCLLRAAYGELFS